MDTLIRTGEPAPNFSLPDLDGRTHSLADYRGRIVVINFWSAECPHAARTDMELLSYLPDWAERAVALTIASNANESPPLLRQTAAERGLSLVLHDARQQVADLYGAVTTPHVFVVDAEGILCYQGAFDDTSFRQRSPTRSFLRAAVEALLAGSHPAPDQTPPYGCAIVRLAPFEPLA
jgi:peroxiredoxin